jgi:hypothetical protein
VQALILACGGRQANDVARIDIMRALNRHLIREFNPNRKDHHWGKRKLARDR